MFPWAQILRVVQDEGPGCSTATINTKVLLYQQLLSYHLRRLVKLGYLQREVVSSITTWTITEAGEKFLAEVERRDSGSPGIITQENFRVKFPIVQQGMVPVDWKRVELTNWAQYVGRVGPVWVQVNTGSLVLIVPKTVGRDPFQTGFDAWDLCNQAKARLESSLGFKLGKGEFLGWGRGRAHFEISGDPVAQSVSKHITVEGRIGAVGDISPPHQQGSLALYDPRRVESYMQAITTLSPEVGQVKDQLRHLTNTTRDSFEQLSRLLEILPGRIAEAVALGVQLGLSELREPRQGKARPGFRDYA